MNPTNVYKHCILCGEKLKKEGPRFFICGKCGHHHYINPSPCNAVIIENAQEEILLVKRKFDPQKGYWDLPGGFIEPEESFEDSAKREIREELDVEIEVGEIIGAYHDSYIYQNIKIPTIGIAASAKIISGKLNPSDDISDCKFFSKNEVLQQQIAFESVERALGDYLKINS